jgi:hypothetical protein
MHKGPAAATKKPRLTTVGRAMRRLDRSRYQVMRMVGTGLLEAEAIDDHVAIITASLEKLEAELRA